MNVTRKWMMCVGGFLVVAILGSAVGVCVLARSPGEGSQAGVSSPRQTEDGDEHAPQVTPVMAVRPRNDANLFVTVTQLLSVDPFFVAGLRAQVPGTVRDVQKDVGDPVYKGEVLVDIQTPDIEEQLREREAVVIQRKQDLVVSQAQADNALAVIEVYKKIISQKQADYRTAVAECDYHKIRYERYRGLEAKDSVQRTLVDEEYTNYVATVNAAQSAEIGIHKAEAELKEKESVYTTALADIELKKTLIDVARKSRDRARAMLDYTRITAPFDGVVVKRNVDVGTFVQNASTGGQTEPLLTIARSDIVTITMKVPDNAAPYVTPNTEAVIQVDELPGVVMRGRVTRFSPWIENRDRTMRVEVDLYNDTPQNYERFKAHALAARLAPTAADSPLALATLLAGTRTVAAADSRSLRDPLPTLPVVSGGGTAPRLIPGMSGYMRLNLQDFHHAYLLPSSAVYTLGGKPYIMEVQDGVTHQLPVHVQVNDGKLAKVSVIEQAEDPSHGRPEVLRDLKGDETIVVSRQTQIGEAQPVRVTMQEWQDNK